MVRVLPGKSPIIHASRLTLDEQSSDGIMTGCEKDTAIGFIQLV